MNRQIGFSLSEVLISLFLTSIILSTLIHMYLSTKRQYLEFQNLLEKRFELQWVTDLLTDSIRRAGFTPCLGIEQLQTVDMRKVGQTLWGIKSENQSRPSIRINRMSDVFSENVSFLSPTELVVSSPVVVNERRPLVIADCTHAEVHQILKVEQTTDGQLITLAKPRMYTYENSVYAGEWLEEQWFIKPNAQHIDTLHYQLGQTEELSPYIQSLFTTQQSIHGKKIVKIKMGLEHDKTHELIVVVRGA
ncbi:PilW family protein [Legionella bononiensis]|uniref:Prepilin-type N-terminal cleavage/methylation domain-containing protein n=1 Tax=Legionella bononiensis TaxID=2793102 RepID=A0ABS1WE92_9GAMM|nr:prepilin-type N-terminal cleavage/methylation domain-containing protein [Legionella bononiensis]MBL7479453.1 prepilin-type N-terminal cleavage/methylation domain-containing protein [Legionella bononiensis]MBL7527673.1 prepilin-type N-terminal cleavage/methylation domain-containing protein [Legionella bononiensis]